MRIMVFHRRTVIIGVAVLVIVLVALCFGQWETQTVTRMNRDLPIYCVDTGEEKLVAISFDAAWGNGRYGTTVFSFFSTLLFSVFCSQKCV